MKDVLTTEAQRRRRRWSLCVVIVVEEAGSKPPEAVRTVAGGASAASDHRYPYAVQSFDPVRGRGVSPVCRRHTETLRDPCRGRNSDITQIPGGRSLALAPPATVRVASGDASSPTTGCCVGDLNVFGCGRKPALCLCGERCS